MKKASKFEIHYFLENDSHSMNAIVRNNCEAELLAIAYEIISQFQLGITLEAEAWREGGLRNRWNALSTSDKIVIALGAPTLLFTVLGVVLSRFPTDDILQDTKNCLEIERLSEELSQEVVSEEVIKKCASLIQKNPKVKMRRSNFYKQLHHNDKVSQVGFIGLDSEDNPVSDEKKVPRADFPKFILRTNKLPVETIEDAHIEIVAPVLDNSRAKWKGIFAETIISFKMNDKVFKDTVIAGSISFKNGDIYECILEIHRAINDSGDIIISKYVVQTVLDKIDSGKRVETESGKRFRRELAFRNAQGSLDL